MKIHTLCACNRGSTCWDVGCRDEFAIRGPLREDFFAGAMKAAGIPFNYLKTNRGAKTPDYLIPTDEGDLIIEIGGKGKGHRQFKGISASKKMLFTPSANLEGMSRPLESLGFL